VSSTLKAFVLGIVCAIPLSITHFLGSHTTFVVVFFNALLFTILMFFFYRDETNRKVMFKICALSVLFSCFAYLLMHPIAAFCSNGVGNIINSLAVHLPTTIGALLVYIVLFLPYDLLATFLYALAFVKKHKELDI